MKLLGKDLKMYQQYLNYCNEVEKFVGLETGSLSYNEIKLKKDSWWPKAKIYLKDGKFQYQINIPSKSKQFFLKPFFRKKNLLRHESRHLAHFALLNNVYNENPKSAHKIIKKDRSFYYEYLQKFLKSFSNAKIISNKEVITTELEKNLEILAYYKSISHGLSESFADDNHQAQNSFFIFLGLSTFLMGGSLIGSAYFGFPEIGEKITKEADLTRHLFGFGSLLSTWGVLNLPKFFYKKEKALITENLKPFSPNERKHLIAFPLESMSLEERCEDLKKIGFKL